MRFNSILILLSATTAVVHTVAAAPRRSTSNNGIAPIRSPSKRDASDPSTLSQQVQIKASVTLDQLDTINAGVDAGFTGLGQTGEFLVAVGLVSVDDDDTGISQVDIERFNPSPQAIENAAEDGLSALINGQEEVMQGTSDLADKFGDLVNFLVEMGLTDGSVGDGSY